MSIIKVYCEICKEHIANVETDDLVYPAVGNMFKSPDTKHGVEAPFDKWAQWEVMFCPHGRQHRITNGPEYVITEGGAQYRIPTYQEVMARGDKEKGSEEGEEGTSKEEVEDERPVEDAPLDTGLLCRVCGKQFKNKSGLTGHMRTHKPGDVI